MKIIKLSNGDDIYCLSTGETHLLYRDLVEERSYFQFNVAIAAGTTVVDVGAHIGVFALLASREAADVRVLALEPLPPLYSALRANYALHEIQGRALPYGAGRRAGRASFTFYLGNTALSGQFADTRDERSLVLRILENRFSEIPRPHLEELAEMGLARQTFECEVKPLSAILRENDVNHIGLLKIDVEKAEFDVLQGIEDADWPRIDQVVVEVHDVEGRLVQVSELLRARGFDVQHSQAGALARTSLYNVFAVRRDLRR